MVPYFFRGKKANHHGLGNSEGIGEASTSVTWVLKADRSIKVQPLELLMIEIMLASGLDF